MLASRLSYARFNEIHDFSCSKLNDDNETTESKKYGKNSYINIKQNSNEIPMYNGITRTTDPTYQFRRVLVKNLTLKAGKFENTFVINSGIEENDRLIAFMEKLDNVNIKTSDDQKQLYIGMDNNKFITNEFKTTSNEPVDLTKDFKCHVLINYSSATKNNEGIKLRLSYNAIYITEYINSYNTVSVFDTIINEE